MLNLPSEPEGSLSKRQRDAFFKLRELLSNLKEADAAYDALEASKQGTIISTDIARFLDESYAKNPTSRQGRDIVPGWDLAWRYAQDRLYREISNRGQQNRLRLMAGGWAAGKTFALEKEETLTPPDLTWDGTLKDIDWAAKIISRALSDGWKVEVVYVYRDLELAIYGSVERALEEGRSVPLDEISANHRDVQQSIIQLAQLFQQEDDVSFLNLHNLGTQTVPAKTRIIDMKELELNGALHYLRRHEQYYSEIAKYLSKS
ncbi:MAG: zeta toxin family protein [Verrucomicrobiales bacterium]